VKRIETGMELEWTDQIRGRILSAASPLGERRSGRCASVDTDHVNGEEPISPHPEKPTVVLFLIYEDQQYQ
jgi:hypothetical protein